MKALNYIRYFLYIGWNWNLRLALFTLYHEIRGEHRYQINTTGTNDLGSLELKGKYRKEAEIYQGASYYLMEKLFTHLQDLGVNDWIVDFGCGKGRVLIVAAGHHFERVTGVEFAKELYHEAEKNISKFQSLYPSTTFEIRHENAIDYDIQDHISVFFFFNPFQEIVMRKVIANIMKSFRRARRPLYIVYVNPQLKKLWMDQGFSEIFSIRKMQFVEACILCIK